MRDVDVTILRNALLVLDNLRADAESDLRTIDDDSDPRGRARRMFLDAEYAMNPIVRILALVRPEV